VGEQGVAGRAEETVVADLGEALGQDVLQEAAEEHPRIEGASLEGARAAVAVAERHLALGEAFEATVDDGDAEDVPREVVEDLLSGPGLLDMDDPLVTPDGGRRLIEETSLAETRAHLGAEQPGQRPPGDEKRRSPGRDPRAVGVPQTSVDGTNGLVDGTARLGRWPPQEPHATAISSSDASDTAVHAQHLACHVR
jgi:hypothetical protein